MLLHLLYSRRNKCDVQESTIHKSNATVFTKKQQQQEQHFSTEITNQTYTKSPPLKTNVPWYKRVFSFSSNMKYNDNDSVKQQTDNRSQVNEICEDFTRPSDTVAAPSLHLLNGGRYIR